MANSNYDAARALANAMGAPQPTPAGRDMAQQIATAFNAYAGPVDTVDLQRPDGTPPGSAGWRPDFWNEPAVQKMGLLAGLTLLALWLMSRKHHED